jgi:ApbE superfamily uncharacterized protein (UPF0280 family)
MYQPRDYRKYVNATGLCSFTVTFKESDLHISAQTDLAQKALLLVRRYYQTIENYILAHPYFHAALVPVEVESSAPSIILDMAAAGSRAGVGPMAAVAGAMAQYVGTELGLFSEEVIVENGGDIYIKCSRERIVSIYAGESPLSGKIGLKIAPESTPAGICTSSGTVGPSLSFGKTDAAIALAGSAILADAAATAVGNAVSTAADIAKGIALAQGISGVTGAVIIKEAAIGVWGNVELCSL